MFQKDANWREKRWSVEKKFKNKTTNDKKNMACKLTNTFPKVVTG